jgi:hypothetical protein
MPKLLVLFHSHSPDVVRLADAAVEGARRVRFAEVDLRRLATLDADVHLAAERGSRPLEHVDDIATYDGLILVAGQGADAGAPLTRALETFNGSLVDKVGSALSSTTGSDRHAVLWSVLTPMAERGMILVPAPFDDHETADESARRAGTRVAEVIGWVTHARSHHHHDRPAHDEQSHRHH